MHTIANQNGTGQIIDENQIGSRSFDWTMTFLSAWLIGGMYLDGWAHLHGKVDESFFTPWHGVLYSGLLAVILFLSYHLYRNHQQGARWLNALPAGYTLSLLGAFIFVAGGGLDLGWHTLFGIEESVEATISPTHLILATGMILIVTGPLRSVWVRRADDDETYSLLLLMMLSLTFALSVLTFFTLYAHPLVDAWATVPTAISHDLNLSRELDVFVGQAAGVAGILLQTAILMGGVFLAVSRRHLPPGSFTVMFTLNAVLMSVLHDRYTAILVAVLAGVAADSLYLWLKPSSQQFVGLLVFACVVPVVYYAFYFLLLALTASLWWSVTMVTGTVILAGVTGLLFGYMLYLFATSLANGEHQSL